MSEPSSTTSSITLWLTDIRKLALINCIAVVLCLLIPIWNGTQRLLPSGQKWIIPVLVLLSLFSAIMPAFYFALYRNQGTLRFPRPSGCSPWGRPSS